MEGYLKVTLLHECFSSFINSKNSTKSRKAPYISSSDTLFAYLHSAKQIWWSVFLFYLFFIYI